MRRRANSASGLPLNAQAWLRGDRNCGFFKFKHPDELAAIWNQYGDSERYHWEPGMRLPEPIE